MLDSMTVIKIILPLLGQIIKEKFLFFINYYILKFNKLKSSHYIEWFKSPGFFRSISHNLSKNRQYVLEAKSYMLLDTMYHH